MPGKSDKTEVVMIYALFGALFIGFASIVFALIAGYWGSWTGAGACLLAGAFAFGLVINAILRQ